MGDADVRRAKDPYAVALGRKGGLKGGKARAERMTPAERSEAARRAALARWRKAEDDYVETVKQTLVYLLTQRGRIEADIRDLQRILDRHHSVLNKEAR